MYVYHQCFSLPAPGFQHLAFAIFPFMHCINYFPPALDIALLHTHTQPTQLFAAGAQLSAHTQPTMRSLMAPAWRLLHVSQRGILTFDLTCSGLPRRSRRRTRSSSGVVLCTRCIRSIGFCAIWDCISSSSSTRQGAPRTQAPHGCVGGWPQPLGSQAQVMVQLE